MSELFFLFFIATVISAIVTFGVLRLMLVWQILDIPNQRSSHSQPTPTLGGIGIIFGASITLVIDKAFFNFSTVPFLGALGFSVLVIFLLCFDEIRPLSRVSKSLVQLIASLILMWAGVVLHRIELPFFGELTLGWAASPVTLLLIFGLQNIYNFMDGIDGIAGVEGLLVSGLTAGLALFFSPSLAPICVVLAGASLGFLFFNVPPAKIFMGDVGAHFLGLSLATIAIWGESNNLPFWITAVFLGAFLYDAIYTIFRRLLRGENITLAHRSHIYQRLQIMVGSPLSVNIVFGAFTLMFGLVGFLYSFGFPNLAFGFACFLVVLIVFGTVYVELRWRALEHQE